MAKAYFREAGSGPAVLCLHCSASSSGQWRPLMERLAGRYRVIAPDLYGCGKSPAWPGERPMWIDDQIELLASAFERAGERFHLIGHSYGGAIALKAALSLRPRLASLVLYEPVLFSRAPSVRRRKATGARDRWRCATTCWPGRPPPRPSASSTTGWARAPGRRRRIRAAPRWSMQCRRKRRSGIPRATSRRPSKRSRRSTCRRCS